MNKKIGYKLTGYPKEINLKDGTVVSLAPMTKFGGLKLLRFFSTVSRDDRFYLKEDVTSKNVVERWASELDYRRALPLLAWVKGKIVGDGAHASQDARPC